MKKSSKQIEIGEKSCLRTQMWAKKQEVLIEKLTKWANQMGKNYFHEKSMKIIRKKGEKW